jgi:hypothetical protein
MDRLVLFHVRRRRLHILGSPSMTRDDFDFWDVSDHVYNAIRAAELAAEGAALQASARAALLHWVALLLLGASLLLGIAMLTLPILRPWYGQAVWIFVLGFACYLLVVAIVYWSRPIPSAPELRTLHKIRHDIAALLLERRRARGAHRDPLIQTLSDAIQQLDEHIIPTLDQLIDRRSNLERELRRYERGELHTPKPELLELLRRLRDRLQTAVDECVQQAANAYAMLVALLQEGDDQNAALRARAWAESLTTLYEALNEVLRGADERGQSDMTGDQSQSGTRHATNKDSMDQPGSADDLLTDHGVAADQSSEDASLEAVTGSRSTAGDQKNGQELSVELLFPHVEEALRRVRDRGQLVGCALSEQLPWTKTSTLQQRGTRGVDATPLEQAAALQQMLAEAVDRLKPDPGSTGHNASATDFFKVLRGQYFEGRPILQLRNQLGFAETTYHRYRRRAIRVLTQELIEQEEFYRRSGLDSEESA